MTDIVLIPDPNRTLTVLRNEADAARDGTLVIDGPDIEMAEMSDDPFRRPFSSDRRSRRLDLLTTDITILADW